MKYIKYALISSCAFISAETKAQSINPSTYNGTTGTFGGVGLLEMRNARFAPDGELAFGVGLLNDGQNYYATWQATPWLETTLRYSNYNNAIDGIDKGLDVKLRLVTEGKYNPAIAVGLQDMLGDGLFSGEYIVASKKIYDFDFTAGFGFGNLSHRARIGNFFKVFDDSFSRRSFENDNSEKIRLGNYFSGKKMGFFWGVEYKTPLEGLTAKLEYSTIKKSQIEMFKDYKSKSAFNIGVNYKVKNWLEVGAGLMHGNQYALHFTLKQNLHNPKKLKYTSGPEVDQIRVRELKNIALNTRDYKNNTDQDIFFERLEQIGFAISLVDINADQIELSLLPLNDEKIDLNLVAGAVLESYSKAIINFENSQKNNIRINRDSDQGKAALLQFRNSTFYSREKKVSEISTNDYNLISKSIFDKMSARNLKPINVTIIQNEILIEKAVSPFNEIPKNIGRTSRILTNEAPDNIERFTIISKDRGIGVSRVSILRKEIEGAADYRSSPEEIFTSAIFDIPRKTENMKKFEPFPNFEFGILPEVVSHFGSDKNDHFKADLNLKLFGKTHITSDLQFYAEAKQKIVGNLDEIPVSINPNVEHVRSDIGLYAREGKTSISRLNLEYIKNPSENIYTRLTAGFLEEMYSGISGEVLYRPYGNNFSFGIDVNFVKQRGYDQLFDLRDYKTVTGHATLYHVNKKYDIISKISAGRYLAKDWGTTFDVSRQFRNGIRIGATATFTNMSQSDFGRGSFDKSIYMIVPFDFFWFKQSRDKATFKFRRLGKNGGQKIDHQTSLYDLLSNGQPHRLENNWNRILE